MGTIRGSWEKRLTLKVKCKVCKIDQATRWLVKHLDYTDYQYYENITGVVSLGFPESRLPSFTKEDSEEIVGSFDFIGINFYTADIVFTKESDPNVVSYYADQDVSSYKVDNYNC